MGFSREINQTGGIEEDMEFSQKVQILRIFQWVPKLYLEISPDFPEGAKEYLWIFQRI